LQLHAGDAEIEGLIFRSPSKLPVTFRSVS
jgi:hypothetical protein